MKNKRQEALLELIKSKVVTTQDELQEALCNMGFQVTQSTISRDIKELRIVKAQDKHGIYRYLVAGGGVTHNAGHYGEMFSRSVIDVLYSMNIVIIKCHSGMASSACVALDKLFSNKVLGSLAGDDTIFAVTSSEEDTILLTKELKKLI